MNEKAMIRAGTIKSLTLSKTPKGNRNKQSQLFGNLRAHAVLCKLAIL